MYDVRQYKDERGRNPFTAWFDALDGVAAVRIERSLLRLARGNTSNVKFVGDGVSELKMDFGPGYRVYFGHDGQTIVVLLGGGTKRRQDSDIASAKERWADYKSRKR
ncbi:MAG: type II toxin-antitoxin system RelE/ParE family toxin [Rhizomicrobium sp.]